MFRTFIARRFVAKIQAELYAQYADQNFINRVCQRSESLELIEQIRKLAYYRKSKMEAFLAVCSVLSDCLSADDVDTNDKQICASLLAQRILRSSDQFKIRHFQLFGDIERQLMEWQDEEGE